MENNPWDKLKHFTSAFREDDEYHRTTLNRVYKEVSNKKDAYKVGEEYKLAGQKLERKDIPQAIIAYQGAKHYFEIAGDSDEARFAKEKIAELQKGINAMVRLKESMSGLEKKCSKDNSPSKGTKSRHLYSSFGILSILFLLSALFFSLMSLTGNVISGITGYSSSVIGLCLFVCGLIFSFVFLRSNRK